MSTADILAALHAMQDRPWSEWRRGKPLSTRGLADLLRPFKVKPTTVRLPGRNASKGYKRQALEPAWNSYLPPQGGVVSVTPLQPNEINDLRGSQSVTGDLDVTDANGRKSLETKDCNGVTDTTPHLPEELQERAAIMEYNGALPRHEAEACATRIVHHKASGDDDMAA